MAYGYSYSSITDAAVPRAHWYKVQPLLESWKSVLQDLPGYMGSDVIARRLENGDVRCRIRVTWQYREQLEAFQASVWATDAVVGASDADLYDVSSEAFEHFV